MAIFNSYVKLPKGIVSRGFGRILLVMFAIQECAEKLAEQLNWRRWSRAAEKLKGLPN